MEGLKKHIQPIWRGFFLVREYEDKGNARVLRHPSPSLLSSTLVGQLSPGWQQASDFKMTIGFSFTAS